MHSNYDIPERLLKPLKFLHGEQTTKLSSPSVPFFIRQLRVSLPPVVSNKLYPVSVRVLSKSAQKKSAKQKKTSRGKNIKTKFCYYLSKKFW